MKYKIKKTKKLIKQLKPFWKELRKAEDDFFDKQTEIERRMEAETGIEGIEFYWCDGGIAGIGNNPRTMGLIWGGELDR